MQQPKRRSKRGVILLAVVVALLVMAVLPASAFAVDNTAIVNDGAPVANDLTVKFTYASASATANWVSFWVRGRHGPAGAWTVWTQAKVSGSTDVYYAYPNGTTQSKMVRLPNIAGFWADGDQFQVAAEFYSGIPIIVGWVESQVVTLDFNGPPVSVLELDAWAGWHPGRGGILWTNGDDALHGPGDVWGTFGQKWNAPMGTTHWVVTKNNDASVVKTPITWVPWGTPYTSSVNDKVLVEEPNPNALLNPKPRYSADGVYQIQHWAVDMFGQRQVTDSYDTFGYDTKSPYVVWQWPATTTGYYTGNIAVMGDIIDDGGSGVAGYFAWAPFAPTDQMPVHFSPKAVVMWKSAETGGEWMPWENWSTTNIVSQQKPLKVQINAFDHYSWHISGEIWVKPYYNAEYAVWVTGGDYAGNDGFPLHDWLLAEAPKAAQAKGADAGENTIGWGIPGQGVVVVDNMAPSTIMSWVDPASASSAVVTANGIGTWTNKEVTLNFVASDTGGSGIGSGVDYTEYIVGHSATTPPVLSASGTKGTSVTIKDPAPTGPVYVWFRSVDKVGNREAWNLSWVYFDNKGPVLSIGGNAPWYNDEFSVVLSATDANSKLAAPGIEYQVPGWPMPWLLPHSGTLIPTVWTPLSQNPGTVWFPVDAYPNSRTDGMWQLQFRATDQAKNAAESTTQTVKIDTRPPATAGAATYGQEMWYNGTKPYQLIATDQNPGAGVKVTWYRVDQGTPWKANVTTSTAPVVLTTDVSIGTPAQGSVHTVDFFSIDNATNPAGIAAAKQTPNPIPYPGNWEKGVVVGWAPIPLHPYINITSVTAYKSTTIKADVTAPAVTAMDPKNGNWQKPLATVNFAGTDVGSGYNHTEWSTDGGTTWTKGEQAQVGGDGEITITYRGVDNVGLMSANQTIVVKVASTPPTVTAQNARARAGKLWKNPTITFNITAVTPKATAVMQIRTLNGQHHQHAPVRECADRCRRQQDVHHDHCR